MQEKYSLKSNTKIELNGDKINNKLQLQNLAVYDRKRGRHFKYTRNELTCMVFFSEIYSASVHV